MATRIVLTDDLDGSEGAETVSFSIDGRNYEIDLAPKSRAAFDKAFTKYLTHARRVSSTQARRRPPTDEQARERRQAIREWAISEGWEVPNRGRLSAAVIEAYDAAH